MSSTPGARPLLIQKFGGTSVGTPERIQRVADRIAEEKRRGNDLVVVVSAMGHSTDELLALAHQVSRHPPAREIDMLLTAGERISMALLSMALQDRGLRARSFTGSQTGIITSPHHRRARIRKILGDRVRGEVSEGAVAIVAGFQGMSTEKEITTLGRGGSDTTAVALAAVLGAERCDIFTDVDGVYSADPRVVPAARQRARIAHEHMVELALRGAGVLHPRSVEIAQKFGVRLRVRNSLKESEGTEIVSMQDLGGEFGGMEDSSVVGVAADDGKCLLEARMMRPSVASAIWDVATEHHLSMLAPAFSDGILRFFVERETIGDWQRSLQTLAVDGFLKSFEIHEDLVPVSVVGSRLTQDGRILARVFEILDQNGVSVTMGSATSLALTLVAPKNKARDAVQALHAGLIEKETK